jgi:hypothetical protein
MRGDWHSSFWNMAVFPGFQPWTRRHCQDRLMRPVSFTFSHTVAARNASGSLSEAVNPAKFVWHYHHLIFANKQSCDLITLLGR